MYDRAYAIATGVFLVAAAAALLITAYWLAGTDPDRRPYVVVSPYSVAGLSVGSEVLYRGVPAGRVERIRIDPQDPSRVLIRIAVEPQVPVLRGTFARLHQRGLTGVAQVELEHGDSMEPLPTTDEHPAHIPLTPSLIQQASDVGTRTLEILSDVADRLDATWSGENGATLQTVAARLDDLLASAERIAAALESDLPRALDRATYAADSVAELAEGATERLHDADALIEELRATAAAARSLAHDLSDTGAPALQRTLDSMNAAAEELGRLAEALAANPSQLLHGRRQPPGPGEEPP
jgi:phospholipid/cholesterol/gamma-HCH transport system substrate-binding protein